MSDIMTKEAHRRRAAEDYTNAMKLLQKAWEHHQKSGLVLSQLEQGIQAQKNVQEAKGLIQFNLGQVFQVR